MWEVRGWECGTSRRHVAVAGELSDSLLGLQDVGAPVGGDDLERRALQEDAQPADGHVQRVVAARREVQPLPDLAEQVLAVEGGAVDRDGLEQAILGGPPQADEAGVALPDLLTAVGEHEPGLVTFDEERGGGHHSGLTVTLTSLPLTTSTVRV